MTVHFELLFWCAANRETTRCDDIVRPFGDVSTAQWFRRAVALHRTVITSLFIMRLHLCCHAFPQTLARTHISHPISFALVMMVVVWRTSIFITIAFTLSQF